MTPLSAIAALSLARRSATTSAHKAEWGQFFTGAEVAAFMAGLLEIDPQKPLSILDPGAGTGMLGVAAAEQALAAGAHSVRLVAVESEPEVLPLLHQALDLARSRHPGKLETLVVAGDFLHCAQLSLGRPTLPGSFDLAIGNPPYFKMSPSEPLGGDAPNAYARFMEVAASLLKGGGQMVFIVPRSFASGLYFRRFRKRFHAQMALQRVHVFASRRGTFREDEVLQENIIVHYRKNTSWPSTVLLSESGGRDDIQSLRAYRVALDLLLDPSDPDQVLSLPTCAEDEDTIRTVRAWPEKLSTLGLDISTGPVVPFRTEALVTVPNGEPVVPLLWMQHLREGQVIWPIVGGKRKPQHILVGAGPELLVTNQTLLLMRRFSAKEEARRLTVGVLLRDALPGAVVGLENHLNFVHRPDGELEPDLAYGLAALLSTTLVDDYFRLVNGNTQVNATEIRSLPLPPLQVLLEIGRRVRRSDVGFIADRDRVDRLVSELLHPTPSVQRPRGLTSSPMARSA